MQADALKVCAEHPAVTPETLLERARANDSCLHAIASGGCSMRLFCATLADGDAFTAGGLDLVPRRAYEDFHHELVRGRWELRSDYLVGTPVLIVRRAPKESRP